MNGAGIPILTYHRIADCERLNTSIFESHLEVLAASGIPSLLPKDLGRAGRGFMLTFDDGFADCWTHVFPLLEKYGVRAVIFVIPAILGEGPERVQGKRVYHDDASQAHQEASVALAPHQAFLRWSELTAMEKSGLVAAWLLSSLTPWNIAAYGGAIKSRVLTLGPATGPTGPWNRLQAATFDGEFRFIGEYRPLLTGVSMTIETCGTCWPIGWKQEVVQHMLPKGA